jgi:hypothetical protein|tara:strand:+ start:419 stop:640 length:222 start_codon:yes stop_codon:yes gene_type:complete
MQQTVTVRGHKIVIKANRNVHGCRFHVSDNMGNTMAGNMMTLYPREAMDRAFARFIKSYGLPENTTLLENILA